MGIESPEYQTTDAFSEMWCSALAHCQKDLKGNQIYIEKVLQVDLGV